MKIIVLFFFLFFQKFTGDFAVHQRVSVIDVQCFFFN